MSKFLLPGIFQQSINLSSGVDLKTGLIAVWELDETSGTTTNDSHSTYNGTNNCTVNQTGIIDKAYSFTAASTQLITVDYSSNLTPSNFSISIWVNPSLTTSSSVFRSAGGSGYSSGWRLYTGSTNFGFSWGTGSEYGSEILSEAYSTSTWYHLVATYDGTNASFYLNNSLVGTTAATIGYHGTPSNYDLQIGLTNGLAYFSGLIDQTALWNVELTTEQITALYNSGNGLAYSSW